MSKVRWREAQHEHFGNSSRVRVAPRKGILLIENRGLLGNSQIGQFLKFSKFKALPRGLVLKSIFSMFKTKSEIAKSGPVSIIRFVSWFFPWKSGQASNIMWTSVHHKVDRFLSLLKRWTDFHHYFRSGQVSIIKWTTLMEPDAFSLICKNLL